MSTKLFPQNAIRVNLSTSSKLNQRIHEQMINSVKKYSNSNPNTISERIKELDGEWDTERVLEANAAMLILISITLGFLFSKWWFFFSALIAFYLLQHAIQGWCPPLPILRKLGVRTMSEINTERTVLKVLRGDFNNCISETKEIIKAVERI